MTSPDTPKTTLNLSAGNWDAISSLEAQSRLTRIACLQNSPSNEREKVTNALANSEILVTGWGSSALTRADLDACPDLKLIIHAAGTLREAFPELSFPPHVAVSNAAHLNARPVAEYTLGLILCSLRGTFTWTAALRQAGLSNWWKLNHERANGYAGRCIVIVGFGLIAKQLLSLIKPFGFEVLVVSKFASAADELAYGFTTVSLEEAAPRADVLSLHEADLPQFWSMIDSRILSLLPDGATLINTARGRLIDEKALHSALANRALLAILDVLENENSESDRHPLLDLPNCVITPHVAGSIKGEVKRFGDYVCDEIENYLHARTLTGNVDLATLANRA